MTDIIMESAHSRRPVYLPYTRQREIELLEEAEDVQEYVRDDFSAYHVEFMGTWDDGEEWRVILTRECWP